MRADDFFVESEGTGPFDARQQELNLELIERVHAGPIPDQNDVDAARGLANLAHQEFVAFGTDGSTRVTNVEARGALSALRAVLTRLGIKFEPEFSDFDSFRSYWKRIGAAGTGGWQARREILAALFDPVHNELADRAAGLPGASLAAPVSPRTRTGWLAVDDEIAELRRHFQNASTPQDYANVGNDCVRVLERLSAAAFRPSDHLLPGDTEPPIANTKARFDRVLEVELNGAEYAAQRKLARAAIEAAQAVKHGHTPDRTRAGIAADAVILVANILRRVSGPN